MPSGFDPGDLMNQARKMKEQMARTQDELRDRVVESEAGGGVVRAFVNGASEVVGIKIDPKAVDPDDLGMLEDLVMVAVNGGLAKANDLSSEEMNKLTGGLGLDGLI